MGEHDWPTLVSLPPERENRLVRQNGNGGDAGDSGAPVFQETGNGEVTLIGILTMAYQPTVSPDFTTVTLGDFVFSPWEGIMPEIPPTFGWPTYWR